MHASFTAVGRQLHGDFLPAVRKPLPSEFKDLVAQLVALDAGMRGSTERSIEVLQPAIARQGTAIVINRVSIGRETGDGTIFVGRHDSDFPAVQAGR
jgi:hypothetical protein